MLTASFRMGTLRMGIIVTLLLMSLMISNIAAQVMLEPNSELTDSMSGNTRTENDIWYIYKLRIIPESKTFENTIIINSSGELRINNSARFELYQDYNLQRNITIKDNGTLRLKKGTLTSNKQLLIKLQDKGKLILEDESSLMAKIITANKNSGIQLFSSTISSGVGGLSITMYDESKLELIDSSIENADSVNAKDKSTIKIKNSKINSKSFGISCSELTLISNEDFKDLKVDSCENLFITDSTIKNMEVLSSNFMQISQKSRLLNSYLHNLNELLVEDSALLDVTIKEIDSTLIIKDSDNISDVEIENCTTLKISDTYIKNFNLAHYSYLIEIRNSIVEQSSILPKKIEIHNSEIKCKQDQLNVLTRANLLEAYNSSFNLPLHFSGTSKGELINCSTSGVTPPNVKVSDDAEVNIYWWLDVKVVDAQNKPLPEATVIVRDLITDELIMKGVTENDGKIKFKVLANTLTKKGWASIDNMAYVLEARYGKHRVEQNTGIWMNENRESQIQFKEVNKETKEPKPLLGTDTIIGIFIFLIVLILIGLSVTGKVKNNKKNKKNKKYKEFNTFEDTKRNGGYKYKRMKEPGSSRKGRL